MEYNPNPTVYKPVRRKTTAKEGSLWVVDAHNSDDESEEPEPIDQDEIFGLSPFLIQSTQVFLMRPGTTQISSARLATRSILT
jgi:hypothetical protein